MSLTTRLNNGNLTKMFADLAKQGQNARVSIEDCYKAILSGNTKGFKNVSNIIKTFNELKPENQRAFAQAVQQTNVQLGSYLVGLDGGKAKLMGYGGQLVTSTAKTVGLTVATTALNAALTMGISFLITTAITALTNWIQAEEKAAEKAKEASKEYNEQTDSINNYIVKITELRTALEDNNILDDQAKTIKEELLDIQKDLVENYGLEADKLNLVNGELKENIELLKQKTKAEFRDENRLNSGGISAAVEALNHQIVNLDQRALTDTSFVFWDDYTKEATDALWNIYEDLGFKAKHKGSASGDYDFQFEGDVYTIEKKLIEAQDRIEKLMNDRDLTEKTYNSYKKAYEYLGEVRSNWSKDLLEKYEEQLIAYIKGSDKYNDLYFNLFAAKANYNAVIGSGDKKKIQEAAEKWKEAFEKAVQEATENEDYSVVSYLTDNFSVDKTVDKSGNAIITNSKIWSDKLLGLTEQLEDLKEATDSAFSNNSTLQSAFDKIQAGTSLTSDEVRKLVEICQDDFPEINTLFTKTADGWTINANDLIRANDAIIKSTKKSVEEQINGYNEVIRAYEDNQKQIENIRNAAAMPDSAKQDAIKGFELGVTAEEYENAKNKAEEWKLVLQMLGLTLADNSNQVSKYNQIIKDNSSKVSLIASAMKEMTDDGHISASTYAELVEKGGNFTACLEIQNGKLVLNIDKLKELEKQEYLNMIAENNLAIKKLETTERTSSNAKAIWEEIQAYKTENALLQQMADEVGNAGIEKPQKDTSDPIKEAFEKEMKDIEHLHNMGLASDKEYYDALEKANEKHYKNSAEHESDYLSNVEKIYKGRQSLYKDDADKQFDDLEGQYKRGIITAEQYAQGLHDLGQELYGEGSIYGGTEFAIKALEEIDKKVKEVSGDIYSELKDDLSADGDRLLENVLADADELSNKNIELFKDTGDLKTFKKNAEDIFKTVSTSALDALERGLITPERYKEIIDKYSQGLDSGVIQDAFDDVFDKIVDKGKEKLGNLLITPDEYFKLIDEWGEKLSIAQDVIDSAKELSEDDYLDAWDFQHGYDETDSEKNYKLRAERIKYIYDLAEKLYGKNGQKNVKAYYALIKKGLEAENDLLKDRLSAEKEYWEERKDAKLKIFDDEIKRLQEIQDEEEKVNKAEELRLNLIKARENLEKAKSQRNQLIFVNGTYQYDVDQDAVMSAQEEVADALKAIKDEELQTQISLLEEQKENAEKFYQDIIDKIDSYEKSLEGVLSSDSDTLNAVFGEGNTILADADKFDKENVDTAKTTEKASDISTDVKGIAKTAFDIMTFLTGGATFESLVKALGGNVTPNSKSNFMDSFASTLVGKQITPSTVAGVTNNNNSTNNNNQNVVFSGDINVNVELSLQSLDDFVGDKIDDFGKRVIAAIKQKMPAVLAKA